MKKSIFNNFLNYGDKVIAFNTRTNALLELTNEEYDSINKINSNSIIEEDENFVSQLTYSGFFVDNEANELDIIRHDMLATRFSNNELMLTIAPTSNCNFRCPYCYEHDVLRSCTMSDETANQIIDFIKKNIKHLNHLSITWYGGEPLLELNRIVSLSSKIIKICDKWEVPYTAAIVTNGYLLNQKCVEKLMQARVKNIQITLDGSRETHDSRRFLVNGGTTFDKILSNLISLGEKFEEEGFPFIGVRMNVDRSNINDIDALINLIYNSILREYVNLYIAGVSNPEDKDHKETFTPKEFRNILKQFENKLEPYGIERPLRDYLPRRSNVHCSCDSMFAYVIDSNGDLYKCWEEIGKSEMCIGNVADFKINNFNKIYSTYMLSDPTTNEKCKKCSILPICMGGECLAKKLYENYIPDCDDLKLQFNENLVRSYKKLIK